MLYYQLLVAIGGIGLVVQALLGLEHQVDHAGHDHHSDFWVVLSPTRLFSLALGVGAAGWLALSLVKSPLLVLAIALVAGFLFQRFVVQPLFRLAMQFASKPATNLAGALAKEAIADSRFDATGKGIVTLTVDGHLTRLLATVDDPAITVAQGDRLVVTEIDGKRGTCRVARL